MLHNNKKWEWRKIVILCSLLIIAIAVPGSTISAKTTTKKDWLKSTLTYCEKLDKSEYTLTSWNVFQTELSLATAIYAAEKTEKEYSAARDALELAKANLEFVDSSEEGNTLVFRQQTVAEIVEEMGAGINLGNTMDGHTGFTPSETTWQSVITTKAYIKSVHDLGFNTVRIPVTWGTKIDDENGYSIDEAWISRVQDIVDYCIAQDMYVIINVHHDGAEQAGWLRVAADDIDPVYEKFEHVWRNIAERFKDYDEHLIFESMNEVTGGGTTTDTHDIQVIMNLNQIFLNVVRSTGSNNNERWLSVPGRYTNIDTTTNTNLGFELPKDVVENRLFVSVHHYDYAFGLLDTSATTKWTASGNNSLANLFEKLVTRFTSKCIPVILGEYGSMHKNNTAERAYQNEAFARICQLDGVVACIWDTGKYEGTKSPNYSFETVDRVTGKSVYTEVTDAIMRGTFLSGKSDLSDIVKNTKVTKITSFTLSSTSLKMIIGDSKKVTTKIKPSKSNDIILWKTSDPTIVTVTNGQVRARGIGTATITAFTQSGSVQKTIKVTVDKKSSAKPCTSIVIDKDSYELVKDKNMILEVKLQPADTDDYVTYKSSDDSIATVSTLGKVVGCSIGTAYITVTTSNGLTKEIKVEVVEDISSRELSVALNVYYNDLTAGYFANETGKAIEITGDGQYTVSFDVSENLSKAAIKAGITSLTNLTAVYIKDYNMTIGKTSKSPLSTCSIMYDKIVVDGVNLTITQKKPKSALKASGAFDTNDPLNAWDGSSVKEVTVTNHVLNLSKIKNPKKIEITFTISGMKFN